MSETARKPDIASKPAETKENAGAERAEKAAGEKEPSERKESRLKKWLKDLTDFGDKEKEKAKQGIVDIKEGKVGAEGKTELTQDEKKEVDDLEARLEKAAGRIVRKHLTGSINEQIRTLQDIDKTLNEVKASEEVLELYGKLVKRGSVQSKTTGKYSGVSEAEQKVLSDFEGPIINEEILSGMAKGELPWTINGVFRAIRELRSGFSPETGKDITAPVIDIATGKKVSRGLKTAAKAAGVAAGVIGLAALDEHFGYKGEKRIEAEPAEAKGVELQRPQDAIEIEAYAADREKMRKELAEAHERMQDLEKKADYEAEHLQEEAERFKTLLPQAGENDPQARVKRLWSMLREFSDLEHDGIKNDDASGKALTPEEYFNTIFRPFVRGQMEGVTIEQQRDVLEKLLHEAIAEMERRSEAAHDKAREAQAAALELQAQIEENERLAKEAAGREPRRKELEAKLNEVAKYEKDVREKIKEIKAANLESYRRAPDEKDDAARIAKLEKLLKRFSRNAFANEPKGEVSMKNLGEDKYFEDFVKEYRKLENKDRLAFLEKHLIIAQGELAAAEEQLRGIAETRERILANLAKLRAELPATPEEIDELSKALFRDKTIDLLNSKKTRIVSSELLENPKVVEALSNRVNDELSQGEFRAAELLAKRFEMPEDNVYNYDSILAAQTGAIKRFKQGDIIRMRELLASPYFEEGGLLINKKVREAAAKYVHEHNGEPEAEDISKIISFLEADEAGMNDDEDTVTDAEAHTDEPTDANDTEVNADEVARAIGELADALLYKKTIDLLNSKKTPITNAEFLSNPEVKEALMDRIIDELSQGEFRAVELLAKRFEMYDDVVYTSSFANAAEKGIIKRLEQGDIVRIREMLAFPYFESPIFTRENVKKAAIEYVKKHLGEPEAEKIGNLSDVLGEEEAEPEEDENKGNDKDEPPTGAERERMLAEAKAFISGLPRPGETPSTTPQNEDAPPEPDEISDYMEMTATEKQAFMDDVQKLVHEKITYATNKDILDSLPQATDAKERREILGALGIAADQLGAADDQTIEEAYRLFSSAVKARSRELTTGDDIEHSPADTGEREHNIGDADDFDRNPPPDQEPTDGEPIDPEDEKRLQNEAFSDTQTIIRIKAESDLKKMSARQLQDRLKTLNKKTSPDDKRSHLERYNYVEPEGSGRLDDHQIETLFDKLRTSVQNALDAAEGAEPVGAEEADEEKEITPEQIFEQTQAKIARVLELGGNAVEGIKDLDGARKEISKAFAKLQAVKRTAGEGDAKAIATLSAAEFSWRPTLEKLPKGQPAELLKQYQDGLETILEAARAKEREFAGPVMDAPKPARGERKELDPVAIFEQKKQEISDKLGLAKAEIEAAQDRKTIVGIIRKADAKQRRASEAGNDRQSMIDTLSNIGVAEKPTLELFKEDAQLVELLEKYKAEIKPVLKAAREKEKAIIVSEIKNKIARITPFNLDGRGRADIKDTLRMIKTSHAGRTVTNLTESDYASKDDLRRLSEAQILELRDALAKEYEKTLSEMGEPLGDEVESEPSAAKRNDRQPSGETEGSEELTVAQNVEQYLSDLQEKTTTEAKEDPSKLDDIEVLAKTLDSYDAESYRAYLVREYSLPQDMATNLSTEELDRLRSLEAFQLREAHDRAKKAIVREINIAMDAKKLAKGFSKIGEKQFKKYDTASLVKMKGYVDTAKDSDPTAIELIKMLTAELNAK